MKWKRFFKWFAVALAALVLAELLRPTWTPSIPGDHSVSELRTFTVNGAELTALLRGADRGNPVVLFVHGGPCCSEIPYARKYQKALERDFTVVHYDQRGSGKSYQFGVDYSGVTAADHVSDLLALTEAVSDCLDRPEIILAGHSYGTYIALQAAAQRPDLYRAYVGIGQMADTTAGELDTLARCLEAAEQAGNGRDAAALRDLEPSVAAGKTLTPRNYVRKYGFAARKIDENGDDWAGFLLGTEYNLLDAVRFYAAAARYQDALIQEALRRPVTEIVTEIDLPVYFVMGDYDGMTSPAAARDYLARLAGGGERVFVPFAASAHYPHLEEAAAFAQWMQETFLR